MEILYTRRAAVFLFLYVIVVIYGSLYPWMFHYSPSAAPLRWLPFSTGGFLLDFLVNVLFYVPLGAAAFLAIDAGAPGLFFAVAIGFTLSFGVEEAQRYTFSRVGDYNDIVSNSLGTAFGAIAAYAWKRAHRRWIGPALARRFAPEGLVLAGLWLAWNGFLLLPAVSRRPSPYGDSPLGWMPAVNEVLGVVIIAIALRPGISTMKKALGPVLLVWLAIQELTPFQWGVRQDFSWLPFVGLFYARPETYYPLVFGKLFFYTAVVWAMRSRGGGWFWPVLIPLAVLAAGEAAQIYVPDRTPETTDLVLMAGGAFLLWMAAPGLWQPQRTGYTACSEVKG
jgi:VanZ family protein